MLLYTWTGDSRAGDGRSRDLPGFGNEHGLDHREDEQTRNLHLQYTGIVIVILLISIDPV